MQRHRIFGFITCSCTPSVYVYTSSIREASRVVIPSAGEILVPRLGEFAGGICQHSQKMGSKRRQCKVLPGRQNLVIMHVKDTFS